MAKIQNDLKAAVLDVSKKIELCAQLRLIANWASNKLDQAEDQEKAERFAAVWLEAEDEFATARAELKAALDYQEKITLRDFKKIKAPRKRKRGAF